MPPLVSMSLCVGIFVICRDKNRLNEDKVFKFKISAVVFKIPSKI